MYGTVFVLASAMLTYLNSNQTLSIPMPIETCVLAYNLFSNFLGNRSLDYGLDELDGLTKTVVHFC